MSENRNKLLSELGARIKCSGYLEKSPPRSSLNESDFKMRIVILICIGIEGYKKLFAMSKKQSLKYFGSGKNAMVYCLCYWRNNEISPIRVISLEGCFIGRETETENISKNCFILVTKKRKFYFRASNEEEKTEWVEAINSSLQALDHYNKSNDELYEDKGKYPEESNCVFLSIKSDKVQPCNSYVNVSVSKPWDRLQKRKKDENVYEEIPPPVPPRITAEHTTEPENGECDSGLSSRASSSGSEHNRPPAMLSGCDNQVFVSMDPEEEDEVLEEKQLPDYSHGVWSGTTIDGYECPQISTRPAISAYDEQPQYDIPEINESISSITFQAVQEEGNISEIKNEGYIEMANEENKSTNEYSYASLDRINDQKKRSSSESAGKTPVPKPRPKIGRAFTDSECDLQKLGEMDICKMSFGDMDIEFNTKHCQANINMKQVSITTSILSFIKKDDYVKFPHVTVRSKEGSCMSIKSCSSEEVVLNNGKDCIIRITMAMIPTYV